MSKKKKTPKSRNSQRPPSSGRGSSPPSSRAPSSSASVRAEDLAKLAEPTPAEAAKADPPKVDPPRDEPKVDPGPKPDGAEAAAKQDDAKAEAKDEPTKDEPTKDEAKGDAKQDEPRVGEPAAAPDTFAPVERSSDSHPKSTKTAKAEPADDPMSQSRPSMRKLSLDDEHTLAFFEAADAHVERIHHEELRAIKQEQEEVKRVTRHPITKEIADRRQRLRKIVLTVVAVAAAASLIVFVRLGQDKPAAPPPDPAKLLAAQPAKTAEPPKTAEPRKSDDAKPPEDTAVVPAAASSAAPAASSAAPAASSAAPAASSAAPAASDAPKAADPDAAKALTKEANKLLNMGKYKAAIEKARESIEADPSDANAYLYLGTALMETGKMADAKEAFRTCVKTATRGPRHECAQFR